MLFVLKIFSININKLLNMGWFKKAFHKATAAVAKVKNFAKPIVTKVKHGWSKAGQWGGYIHTKVVPKVKDVLMVASAIPYVQEAAIPALAAVESGDAMLGKALEAKAKVDATAGRMQHYHDRIGQYSSKFKDQIKRGDVGGVIKTGTEAYKEGRAAYTVEKANAQNMRDHFN
tara:strand:- start:318 stop:836 length:519 start_codon:yes stop_codon:yes gene_type:complete